LVQYLKKAEAELEKPPSTTGQDLAKKDYSTKKVNIFSVKNIFIVKRGFKSRFLICNIFLNTNS
jgi:hypothetical protein